MRGETSGYILGSASAGVHPRVLAPFAVDQAADLCSCGHENDDSAAGLKRIPLVRSRGTPVAQEVAIVPTGNLVRGLYIEDLASAW